MHTRREFIKIASGGLVVLSMSPTQELEALASQLSNNNLEDPALRKELKNILTDICDWILTFNIERGILKKGKYSNTSIWVTGNFARVLLVNYSITGKEEYLRAAIGWGDYFVDQQLFSISLKGNPVGYWHTHLDRNNIYFGDTGTAAVALAIACQFVNRERKERYIKALELYAQFVIEGCKEDPDGLGRGNSPGWIIRVGGDTGAVGCGYYKGHVSRLPYTIATGTTGGGFFSALYNLSGNKLYKNIATNAVSWIFKTVKESGEIPYIIDNNYKNNWPYNTMTYCSEGILGTYWRVEDLEAREMIRREAISCVRWLVETQNEDGTWGKEPPDRKRSPGVTSLLVWYYNEVKQDQKVLLAILRYYGYLLDKKKAEDFGVKRSTRTTGFAALGIGELLEPGITFLGGKQNQRR